MSEDNFTISELGFKPDTRSMDDMQTIMRSAVRQNVVRQWLQKQGIPYKAAKSAIPESLAKAYTNAKYLNTWRSRINPDWNLINPADSSFEIYPAAPPPLPPTTNANPTFTIKDQEALLRTIFSQMETTTQKLINARLSEIKIGLDDSARREIKSLAEGVAKQVVEALAPPRTIEINNIATGETHNIGQQHERFPTLLKAMQARDHRGFRLNIWLTGPTGSGKTTAAENAAKALSLPFGSDGSLDADYKVLGFRDATGNVVSTQFLDIYERGGIYVADEIDNWLPSALLSLNAALANGWCSSPRGLIKRHPDCCVIACANTWGLGATSDYVGRTRLDAASLDRFHPKLDWPVDEKLEREIANANYGPEGLAWHDIILNARAKTKAQGLKIIVSPRATFNGIALLKTGFSVQEVADMTIGSGLSPEQKQAIGINGLQTYREEYDVDLHSAKIAIENYEAAYKAALVEAD